MSNNPPPFAKPGESDLLASRASPRATSTRGAGHAERVVLRLLEQLDFGTLDLQAPDGGMRHFGQAQDKDGHLINSHEAPRACIALHNRDVFGRVLAAGDIGLAESFMDGDWDTPDLTAVLVLMMRNRDVLERVIYGSVWGSLLHRVRHLLRRNSRAGSRRNIQAHYDLGNDFYRLWLDPTMNYSSAWFNGDRTQTMPQAQNAKVDRALDEALVGAGQRVLEIGCGWGALAERAAQRQAHITGVTLSHEQLAWARSRMAEAGLATQSDLQLKDYRDIGHEANFKPFDAVVSIEMFEAVGREYWAGYFNTVRRCLAPDGRACIQSITIRDDLFERYVKSTDFIQQYVFPGGLLPSASVFRAEAAKAGLVVERELAFGGDYAETLRRWREQFLAALPHVKGQGFDARFIRLWEFYLAYCEAAFTTGNTNVVQFTLRHA
jgi:cyclopropane-fatty-acyl-phospholipid synthase